MPPGGQRREPAVSRHAAAGMREEKMRRTSLIAALAAVAGLMLTGPVHAQQKQFAYLTPGLDLPFWRYLSVGIADEAKKHNATVTNYDSHNDAATQLKNAQDAIARHVDGILISPTDSSTAP